MRANQRPVPRVGHLPHRRAHRTHQGNQQHETHDHQYYRTKSPPVGDATSGACRQEWRSGRSRRHAPILDAACGIGSTSRHLLPSHLRQRTGSNTSVHRLVASKPSDTMSLAADRRRAALIVSVSFPLPALADSSFRRSATVTNASHVRSRTTVRWWLIRHTNATDIDTYRMAKMA